ncbi:hypothetical protein B296_00022859 [Ensete ventricosum]|uniref:Retrotransposon gag domain-containing protein n=1 Tax=Ensete ventricosum TaxID=4639 RepID=A0A426ZA92_ENSVE|nr:hypothetical protein B296_00022859 [Ensete ventricosum]
MYPLRFPNNSWLPLSSIHSYNQLTREFEGNFLSSTRTKSTTASLLRMRQKEEHLGQYLTRFTDEIKAILDAHPSLVIQAFMIRIRPSRLFGSLVECPPVTVPEMLQRVSQYVVAKTLVLLGKEGICSRRSSEEARPQGDPGFTFDSESEYPDHDDDLVITPCIANACVRRIMIDIVSSTDILYIDSFHKLGMTNRDLAPMTSTLTRFTGDAITPIGVATLPVTFGEEPRTKTIMVHFMVVDLPSAYNVIIGQPTLNKLRVIVSTYHRSIKFSTSASPGEIKSDA